MDGVPPAGGDSLSRTLGSPRHRALVDFVIKERKAAGLTQVQVAKKLRRYQSYVTLLETGQRRLDVVEFMDIAARLWGNRLAYDKVRTGRTRGVPAQQGWDGADAVI
jgi:cyanate lyase